MIELQTEPTMSLVYIGIGSNLGDREELVLRSVHELRSFSRVKKISTLRETNPVGFRDQPKFLNAVVEIETDYSPRETLSELLKIEDDLGRERTFKDAPRTIDLDLLSYDDQIFEEPDLKIPHPRMHERRFVLEPLAELAPAWIHPTLNQSISVLLAKLPKDET